MGCCLQTINLSVHPQDTQSGHTNVILHFDHDSETIFVCF